MHKEYAQRLIDYSTQNINHGAPHNLLLHTRDSMHTIVFNAPFPRYNVAFNVVFNGVQSTLSIRPSPQSIHHTKTMTQCIEMLQCIHCSNYSTQSLLCQDRGSGSAMSGQRQRSRQRQWQRWRELHLFLEPGSSDTMSDQE